MQLLQQVREMRLRQQMKRIKEKQQQQQQLFEKSRILSLIKSIKAAELCKVCVGNLSFRNKAISKKSCRLFVFQLR
jgi:ABC-type cobalamin transport system permease subunit